MSDFYSNMQNTLDNVTYTENGMEAYKHTEHALTDFGYKTASYRNNTYKSIEDFKKVIAEKDPYILKYLMYLRDIREGLGERKLFRNCLPILLNSDIEDKDTIFSVILDGIIEFGRYDDLFTLLTTQYKDKVIELIKTQLNKDLETLDNPEITNKSISLLAKWMPSENTSSQATRNLATYLRENLGMSSKEYRQTLSKLRKHLKVVETMTCAKKWNEIDYNAVPSKANLLYANAFLKNDEERRRNYLASLRLNVESVKINMSVTYPHEIVSKYSDNKSNWYIKLKDYDESLEMYWKNLKASVGLDDTIVVRDGSGSMETLIGSGKTTALDVSTALAVYCSQYLKGTFKNKFITFSHNAQLIDLSDCESLHSKLEKIYKEDDCTNTNIQNVFELILKTARDNHICPEDMPKNILIISDMEFDPANSYWGFNAGTNVFTEMQMKYKLAGYQLPKLIFWNVNSRTGAIPCINNENGVLLVSGFSQNILNMVMNGETDSYKALIKELDKKRYANIPLIKFA